MLDCLTTIARRARTHFMSGTVRKGEGFLVAASENLYRRDDRKRYFARRVGTKIEGIRRRRRRRRDVRTTRKRGSSYREKEVRLIH